MTAAVPSPVDRKLYGDLADDIVLLRSDGRIVARFKAGFRVDSWPEIFTAAQVRGMAAEVRNRRQARKPDAPRSPMARHEIERPRERPVQPVPAGGGDGTVAASDPGSPSTKPTADVRDKFWRAVGPTKSCGGGESRPAETTYSLDCGGGAAREEMPASEEADNRFGGRALDAGGVIPPRRKPALSSATGRNGDTAGVAPGPQDICGCGRPEAHGGRCWARRGWPGPDKGPTAIKRAKEPARVARDGNIAALWAEVDALKSAAARIEKAVADLRGLLSMEGLR